MDINASINKAISQLLKYQYEDGRFEGDFSSNTFPTCAYVLVQKALGLDVDDDIIKWFSNSQNNAGYWGLDASGGSDKEATMFAKLALMEIDRADVRDILSKIPDIQPNLWIVKLLYARLGYLHWNKVKAPKILSFAISLLERLKPLIPQALLSHLKPPIKYAPPVDLFYTPTFKNMFIAERYTLAPLFLIIELNNEKRDNVIRDLVNYLLENRWSDGSWFRVGLITALSVLALIDAKNAGFQSDEVEKSIQDGNNWLKKLRAKDGGCREALNLNVWDTVLSIIALKKSAQGKYTQEITKACEWLIKNQNTDGGWSFSGITGDKLLSDADDTSLAVYALLLSGISKDDESIQNGLNWLKVHQSADGGWGAYRPGLGDINCVSVTSHAILALLSADNYENEIERAIKWIRSCIHDDGYWNDLWLARKTYGTACALNALIKAGYRECNEVKRGINWLERMQNPDGGWGENINGERTSSTIEQTAWSTEALLLYDKNNKSAKDGIGFLVRNQNQDGSWNASCVGIYWEVIGGYVDTIYPYVFGLMALNCYLQKE